MITYQIKVALRLSALLTLATTSCSKHEDNNGNSSLGGVDNYINHQKSLFLSQISEN